MKSLIVGAGALARITAEILSSDRNIELVGLVHSSEPEDEMALLGYPVLGDHSTLEVSVERGIGGAVVAVGDNAIRERHYYELRDLGYELIKAVHHSALVASDSVLGDGVIVGPGAIISTGCKLGDNTVVQAGAVLGVGVETGENVHIREGVTLGGACVLQRNAYVGVGATIAARVVVGKNATVSPGSSVVEDVPGIAASTMKRD